MNLTLFAVLLCLSGCGSGPGLGDYLDQGAGTVGTPPAGAPPGSTKTDPSLDAEENAFLGIINEYRASQGLGALVVSPTLETSSRWLSQDMAAKGYFDHTDSLGRDFGTRLSAFGYGASTAGENIAAGNADAQSTFTQWKNSPGHNANMLGSGYKAIGIARYYDASSPYGWYWTTDFGSSTQ